MYTRDMSSQLFVLNKAERVKSYLPTPSPQVSDYSYYLKVPGTRTGARVENRQQLIREGRNASSNYFVDIQTVKLDPGNQKLVYSYPGEPTASFTSTWEGNVFVPSSFVSHLATNLGALESKALAKTYDKIRDERSQMNGLQFLGELRETIHMLKHPAEALTKQVGTFLSTLSKRKRRLGQLPPNKRQAEWSKVFSGSLLEANFGWAPFISDVKSIAESVGRIVIEPRPRTRLMASPTASNSLSVGNNVSTCVNPSYFFHALRARSETVTESSFRIITNLEWTQRVAEDALSKVARISGFTAENILPTLYELVPLSFLADYMSNLGDVINGACTNTSNVSWAMSVLRQRTKQVTVEDYAFNLGLVIPRSQDFTVGSVKTVRTTLTRTANYVLGVPTFHLSSPLESVKHMANVIALCNEFRHPVGALPSRHTSYRL